MSGKLKSVWGGIAACVGFVAAVIGIYAFFHNEPVTPENIQAQTRELKAQQRSMLETLRGELKQERQALEDIKARLAAMASPSNTESTASPSKADFDALKERFSQANGDLNQIKRELNALPAPNEVSLSLMNDIERNAEAIAALKKEIENLFTLAENSVYESRRVSDTDATEADDTGQSANDRRGGPIPAPRSTGAATEDPDLRLVEPGEKAAPVMNAPSPPPRQDGQAESESEPGGLQSPTIRGFAAVEDTGRCQITAVVRYDQNGNPSECRFEQEGEIKNLRFEPGPTSNSAYVSLPSDSLPGEEYVVRQIVNHPDGEQVVTFWTIINDHGSPRVMGKR